MRDNSNIYPMVEGTAACEYDLQENHLCSQPLFSFSTATTYGNVIALRPRDKNRYTVLDGILDSRKRSSMTVTGQSATSLLIGVSIAAVVLLSLTFALITLL